jgi:glycosyltransferase involved in cell wall biosynthesis
MSGQPGELSAYPLDLAPLLASAREVRSEQEISAAMPEHHLPNACQPTIIAEQALIEWDAYLATGSEPHREAFLSQAVWLLEHATIFAGELAGWPVLTRLTTLPEPVPLLSASTQGLALSVLVRAYRLTSDEAFLQMAGRAARAFTLDIFDGGVSGPIGSEGLFFEEVAAYPAAHHLISCLIALCGLYDYLAVADDAAVAAHVQRCLSTLSTLAPVFDTGYWSRADLASRRLADAATHALHIALLKALAQASGVAAWAALAERWAGYQHSPRALLRRWLANKVGHLRQICWRWLHRRLFRGAARVGQESPRKVCVPITAFPVPGGMRSVLAGVAQAMAGIWDMEYLTWHVGPHHEGLTIWSFGNAKTANWQFPNVWFYAFAGWRRLVALLRQGRGYQLILAQDGVFTGAYAALAARLAGVRMVSMDHGNITLSSSQTFRIERLHALNAAPWRSRVVSRLRFACYWPSLRLLARIATSATDFFLAAGDAVEAAYQQQFGVSADRISQFPFLIDTERYAPCDALTKAQRRAQLHLPVDGVIVAMVNRLAPAKGIDIALQGISRALSLLPDELRARVRVVIAGDGPLRKQIEEEIRARHLDTTCLLWGETSRDDVAQLLSVSDLFLFTALRDITSVAVLEGMAAGLMVIASTTSPAKTALLADGRGLAIPVGDAEAVGAALAEMLCDLPRARNMGAAARAYITTHHSAEVLRQYLLRATGWPLTMRDINRGLRESDLSVAEPRQ